MLSKNYEKDGRPLLTFVYSEIKRKVEHFQYFSLNDKIQNFWVLLSQLLYLRNFVLMEFLPRCPLFVGLMKQLKYTRRNLFGFDIFTIMEKVR